MQQLKIAVYGSVLANVVLFVLQLIAAISSGSLSIFATMADAFMDLLSSAVLLWATRQAARPNLMKYPAVKMFLPSLYTNRTKVLICHLAPLGKS
jgi:divalent metal cation (Fe/Co/Zn/Cd) transporter